MKIAFTTSGNTLEDAIDPRFGRCDNFLIYDDSEDSSYSIRNEGSSSGGGAGIKAAQTLIDNGVNVVITGNVGPNAFKTMSLAGIEIHSNASGKIKDTLAKYREGSLGQGVSGPTVGPHHGTQ
ncbi:MAG: NifB/NifX family molybdenum-iron cluster-binding protein [Candidatus Methanofastidiosa archaeon]|nr:NifB/NifX family molybdenum-iron cluster-binding protein [Candidatus Methanofastidiosa archaeon]